MKRQRNATVVRLFGIWLGVAVSDAVAAADTGSGATGAPAPSQYSAKSRDEPVATVHMLGVVEFAYRSYGISKRGRREIERIAAWLMEARKVKVMVEGHCSDGMSYEYAIAFGGLRAETVMNALVERGISPDRINVVSMGNREVVSEGRDGRATSKCRTVMVIVDL